MKVDTTNSRVFPQGSFAWQLGKTLCTVMRFAVTIFLTTSSIQCLAEDKEHKTTTKEIHGPAGRIHIDDGGAGGVPVVLVHSFAGTTEHWKAQLAHLRKTRRAVALDLRGHGQSDVPKREDYAVESLAGDIAAVADGLKLKRFVLVGHSLGGAIALSYAGAYPERVAGLVLAGAPGKVPPEQAQKIMESLKSDYDKIMGDYWANSQPQVAEEVQRGRARLPRAASLSLIEATFRYDPVRALRRYRGPKLAVITPESDKPYDLHKLAPDLSHRLITGTSHWMQMDKPEEFNRILDEFLKDTTK